MIQGYEVMHMIRKGQVRGVSGFGENTIIVGVDLDFGVWENQARTDLVEEA